MEREGGSRGLTHYQNSVPQITQRIQTRPDYHLHEALADLQQSYIEYRMMEPQKPPPEKILHHTIGVVLTAFFMNRVPISV